MIAAVLAGLGLILDLIITVVRKLLVISFILILGVLAFILAFATLLAHIIR